MKEERKEREEKEKRWENDGF